MNTSYLTKHYRWLGTTRTCIYTPAEWRLLPYLNLPHSLTHNHRHWPPTLIRRLAIGYLQVRGITLVKKVLQTYQARQLAAKIRARWDELQYMRELVLGLPASISMAHGLDLLVQLHQHIRHLTTELATSPAQPYQLPPLFRRGDFAQGHHAYTVLNYLQQRLAQGNYCQLALLHGSYASRDFIEGWSDLDMHIVLAPDILCQVHRLVTTRRCFTKLSWLVYAVDPLAHHRLLGFLSPADLACCPFALLPLPFLHNGRVLVSADSSLIMQRRDDRAERLQSVWRMLTHFRRRVLSGRFASTAYQWKIDLANFMLFPALVLQALGYEISKRRALEQISRIFPRYDWQVLEQASTWRRQWPVRSGLLRWYPPALWRWAPVLIRAAIHYATYHTPLPTVGERVRWTKQVHQLCEQVAAYLWEQQSL